MKAEMSKIKCCIEYCFEVLSFSADSGLMKNHCCTIIYLDTLNPGALSCENSVV